MKVIGVTEDFHFASFRNEIKPFAFVVNPRRADNLTIKLNTQNIAAAIEQIENKWKAIVPGQPFSYSFMDEQFNNIYRAEQRISQISVSFAVLAILIACLGLLGLSLFTTFQRTKEIGIRKVLGASVSNIVTLLARDFINLVVIAFVISLPVAWFVVNDWLQNFAYRINVNGWIFFAAGLLAAILALATISFQTIRAAIANPVKSLRTE